MISHSLTSVVGKILELDVGVQLEPVVESVDLLDALHHLALKRKLEFESLSRVRSTC